VLTLVNGEERCASPRSRSRRTAHCGHAGLREHAHRAHLGRRARRPGGTVARGWQDAVCRSWRSAAGLALFEKPLTDNADVAGRGREFPQTTRQRPRRHCGVSRSPSAWSRHVLTPTGDHRFLAGEVRGDDLYLSPLRRGSAYLYRAHVNERGELEASTGRARLASEASRRARSQCRARHERGGHGAQGSGGEARVLVPRPRRQALSLSDPRFQGKW